MFEFINDILTSEVHDERIVGYIISDNEKAQRINHAHHYYSTYLHYISRHFYPYTIYNKVKIGKPSKKDDTKDFIVK